MSVALIIFALVVVVVPIGGLCFFLYRLIRKFYSMSASEIDEDTMRNGWNRVQPLKIMLPIIFTITLCNCVWLAVVFMHFAITQG